MHNIFCMAPEVREAFEHVKTVESHRHEGRLDPRDIDVFWLRFERYFDDRYYSLTALYGDREDALVCFGPLFGRMVEAYSQPPVALKLLDLDRRFTPQWFQRSHMVSNFVMAIFSRERSRVCATSFPIWRSSVSPICS